ncbi:MAG: hypothetical protein ACRCSP_10225 [Rhodoglobus sp.]
MELLFVTVIGACLGAITRYILPKRSTYGAFLLPAVGAAVTSSVWVALLWAGLRFDGTWIWVASLGVGILISVLVAIVLPRKRMQSDTAQFAQLAKG